MEGLGAGDKLLWPISHDFVIGASKTPDLPCINKQGSESAQGDLLLAQNLPG